MNVYGGFASIDMQAISTDFDGATTSGSSHPATTPSAELQATILAAVEQRRKPILICGLKAHVSTTRYDQFEQPFIPAPFIKDTATSGHVKWTSTNVTGKVTVAIVLDTTTATGVTTVKVNCSTAQ